MLTIRITGIKLQTARRLLGWSLQELATLSGVNWLTIKKYESAGDYLPPASVGALDRLVSALENAGVQFDVGALTSTATQPSRRRSPRKSTREPQHHTRRRSLGPTARYRRHNGARSAGEDFVSVGPAVLAPAISKLPAAERDDACDGSPL